MGEKTVLDEIKKDAESGGSPVKQVLEKLSGSGDAETGVESRNVSGVYRDGQPWSGVIANTGNTDPGKSWKFVAVSTTGMPRRVTTFCKEFEEDNKIIPGIAWNGGYILNPELVGKLGLPETYIGSPLGMIISDHKVLSPPLFNKAAMLIGSDGSLNIQRVNISRGFEVYDKNFQINFLPDAYNNLDDDIPLAYFDLLCNATEIPAKGRVIVRLAGSTIKEIVYDEEKVKIIPVGLTLSFRKDMFPEDYLDTEKKIGLKLNGFEEIEHAVEAGPILLSGGKLNINMKAEGWKTRNSIITQAARLDYTDMRGPKIAAGINSEGNLSILTINGRLRESVGATHLDIAEILQKHNIVDAMGFDPKKSSTLVVAGETKNISPYNHEYEKNIYSLPPEPRAVSNAVIGYITDKK